MTASCLTTDSGVPLAMTLALVEDQDALGQSHYYFHYVLDDDDGDTHVVNAPHQGDRRLQFGRRQAGERFVEQQQARIGGEHAGDFEALASPACR